MTNDLKWNEKSHSYTSKGFMRLERLDLYMHAIKDEVKKHLDIWYIKPIPIFLECAHNSDS